MLPEQEAIIIRAFWKKATDKDILDVFGEPDGRSLGLRLLRDAIMRQDPRDADLALVVAALFGFTKEHVPTLIDLSRTSWHELNERAVAALEWLHAPESVDALYEATQWVPGYLEYDETRAMAVRAIWGLGGIPGPEAEEALHRISKSADAILRRNALNQLKRRGASNN